MKKAPPSPPPSIKKEKEKEEQITPPLPPEPLPKGGWEATKEPEKEEKLGIETPPPSLPTEPSTTLPPPSPPPLPSVPPLSAAFAHLPPQIQQLFERMVGVMTVMHETGISETTINLDHPQFATSVFYGAQIVITEFSTAPKEFNIELLGNPPATKLFAENTNELVAAFEAGNYNFKVHRIDTGYLPRTGEAKRKEARRVKRKKT